jgi:hypothetical protein
MIVIRKQDRRCQTHDRKLVLFHTIMAKTRMFFLMKMARTTFHSHNNSNYPFRYDIRQLNNFPILEEVKRPPKTHCNLLISNPENDSEKQNHSLNHSKRQLFHSRRSQPGTRTDNLFKIHEDIESKRDISQPSPKADSMLQKIHFLEIPQTN